MRNQSTILSLLALVSLGGCDTDLFSHAEFISTAEAVKPPKPMKEVRPAPEPVVTPIEVAEEWPLLRHVDKIPNLTGEQPSQEFCPLPVREPFRRKDLAGLDEITRRRCILQRTWWRHDSGEANRLRLKDRRAEQKLVRENNGDIIVPKFAQAGG